jgi:drug/metabolite transporter (DMT)-like permease
VATGELGQVHLAAVSMSSLGAFAYLIVIGSIGAYTAYGWLLRSGTSSVAVSTYAYVNPAIAVGLGWLFVGETVGGREIAAGAVILSSVGMLMLGRAPRTREERVPDGAKASA